MILKMAESRNNHYLTVAISKLDKLLPPPLVIQGMAFLLEYTPFMCISESCFVLDPFVRKTICRIDHLTPYVNMKVVNNSNYLNLNPNWPIFTSQFQSKRLA